MKGLRPGSPPGFTLIELLLVIALISLMLFFAVPQFQSGIFADGSRRSTILLKQTIEGLKSRAVQENRNLTLHMNLDTHSFWITDETMDEEARLGAQQNATELSDTLLFEDVEFFQEEKAHYGEISLHFDKQGYSDRARIHVQKQDGSRTTLVLESFLADVRVEEDYVSY